MHFCTSWRSEQRDMTVGSSCIELRREVGLSMGSALFALRWRQESDSPLAYGPHKSTGRMN